MVRFARPEDGLEYLHLGAAHQMLEEAGPESWVTGPLEALLGRGMNLQIEVSGLAALVARLEAVGVVPFRRRNGIGRVIWNTGRRNCWFRIPTGIFCASSRCWDAGRALGQAGVGGGGGGGADGSG